MEKQTSDLQHELEKMIGKLSPLGLSWPDDRERHIQTWVDAGDPTAPLPFAVSQTITPEFFFRLVELRHQCGGWIYWNNDLRRPVFAHEDEWQKIRVTEELAEAEFERRLDARRRESAHFFLQLHELPAIARADTLFWSRLKNWELDRESKRPPQSERTMDTHTLSGPVRVLNVDHRRPFNDIPVDPIFIEFLARNQPPHEKLSLLTIIFSLRKEMRQELGFDETMQWPDGPSIGLP